MKQARWIAIGQTKPEIVIGMFADQVDTARGAKEPAGLAPPKPSESFSYDARFDNQSINPPKIAITRPAYRFTLMVGQRSRACCEKPMPIRMLQATGKTTLMVREDP